MKIWTELESGEKSCQAKVGVHIEGRKSKANGMIDHIFDGVINTMEISGILKALKEYDEIAFNIAMERFIEEELSEAEKELVEEDEDDE